MVIAKTDDFGTKYFVLVEFARVIVTRTGKREMELIELTVIPC